MSPPLPSPLPHQPAPSSEVFHALAQSLNLPPAVMVGDAMHFLIGDHMNVVGVFSKTNQPLLIVELAPLHQLSAQDWRRLAQHLSDQFDQPYLGRLMTLDHQLSMAWSFPTTPIAAWVELAQQAMLRCIQMRQTIFGATR